MGVFNLNQINDLLNSTELKISEDLKDEIMEFLKNEQNYLFMHVIYIMVLYKKKSHHMYQVYQVKNLNFHGY